MITAPVRRARRAALAALAALAVVAPLAGCSTASSDRWLKNSQERMYVRVPKAWSTFTVDPYAQDRGRPAARKRNTARWSVTFDSAPKPTAKNLRLRYPAHPVGEMSVLPLNKDTATGGDELREYVSITQLRSIALDETTSNTFDPVKQYLQGDPTVEVIRYDEIARKDGMHGVALRFNYRPDGGRWVTIDQRILVDRTASKLYRLVLKCESSCYKRDYAQLRRIADSWTVRK